MKKRAFNVEDIRYPCKFWKPCMPFIYIAVGCIGTQAGTKAAGG